MAGARVMVLLMVGPRGTVELCWPRLLVATIRYVLVLLTCECRVLVENLVKMIERGVLTWVYVSTVMMVLGTTGRQTVMWLLVAMLSEARVRVVWVILCRSLVQATVWALFGLFLKHRVIRLLRLLLMRWLIYVHVMPSCLFMNYPVNGVLS